MKVIFFSNVTDNTQRFITKLDLTEHSVVRVPVKGDTDFTVKEPYLLITPTYGDASGKSMVPRQVKKFLQHKNNWKHMVGVVASGNRNFGEDYGKAGNVISEKFNVPLFYKFELAGDETDVATVKQLITNLTGLYNL